MKILVCDDEEISLKVVQVALQDRTDEIVLARDGRQAMELLNKGNDFDLVITDIHMPHYNGDDILKLIREDQKKNTPIIMLSSDDGEEVIALALKQGVNEFIAKPLDAKDLIKKIGKYLK